MSLLANIGSPLSHIDMSNNNIEDRGNTARDLFYGIKFFVCGLYYRPREIAYVSVFFWVHKPKFLFVFGRNFFGNNCVS